MPTFFPKNRIFLAFILGGFCTASGLQLAGLDVSMAEVLVLPTLWLVIDLYRHVGGK